MKQARELVYVVKLFDFEIFFTCLTIYYFPPIWKINSYEKEKLLSQLRFFKKNSMFQFQLQIERVHRQKSNYKNSLVRHVLQIFLDVFG